MEYRWRDDGVEETYVVIGDDEVDEVGDMGLVLCVERTDIVGSKYLMTPQGSHVELRRILCRELIRVVQENVK